MTLKAATGGVPAVVLSYGKFIQTVVDFSIVAFSIFIAIKAINTLKRQEQEAPKPEPAPSKEEALLTRFGICSSQKNNTIYKLVSNSNK